MHKSNFTIFLIIISIFIAVPSFSLFFIMRRSFNSKDNVITFKEPETYKINKKKIRILIDPGHTADTVGSKGILGLEYKMTYKAAEIFSQKLSENNRFEYFLSRDGDYYSAPIKNYMESNYNTLSNILKMKIEGEKRSGRLTHDQTAELYAVRKYAIDNGFDILVSLHFDYTPNVKRRKDTKGFQIIISPYNREFPASMKIALNISDNLRKIYPVSPTIDFDSNLPKSVWNFYNKENLRQKGISIRSLVVLGDVFEYSYYVNMNSKIKDIPSILIELGYMHDSDFMSENSLKKISNAIYEALLEIYKTA